ncbi:hypothetical protein [Streptomyces mirabilis]|uniref:hypothetical protein n=1 Tax=Streptomyces mirabilis TaxID=68239 RepID=UPI0028F71CE0|nr:hypothetical protein [Streptomyces mirabilis]
MIVPGPLELRDGAVEVPTGPGLGVELDHAALKRLDRRYLDTSEDHHGTTPSSSNSRPVGPSSGRVANRMAITAPCSAV